MGDTLAFVGCVIIVLIIYAIQKNIKPDPVKERHLQERREICEAEKLLQAYGPISPQYICPHCQTKGHVRTIPVKRKKGVSGAKVTGALLTFGVSMLATGLSRKEGLTQAHCGNCDSTWDF
ncbi:MAG: hypothetical protein ACYDH8_09745 [Syntrophales bacterium]